MDVLNSSGKKIVPILAARGGSGGVIEGDVYRKLEDEIVDGIVASCSEETEGVLLGLHGAMVAEGCDDPEGHLLKRIREGIGPEIPIAITLDPHALVTDCMLANADIITGYRTFPHVDEYETGIRAATLLLDMIAGKIYPVMEAIKVPVLLPPHSEIDTAFPLNQILSACRRAETENSILDASFFPVQPWLDLPETCTIVLVIADGKREKAREEATAIAELVWELKEKFVPSLVTPKEAVRRAMERRKGRIALSEASDAPPAGGPGDGIELLAALLREAPLPEWAYVIVVDKEAVDLAHSLGKGKELHTTVGHKNDPRWGKPVEIRGTIDSLQDSSYCHVDITGIDIAMGKTAVVQIDRIMLVLCSHAFDHYDPNAYRAVGLDPEKARILGVKSTLHFKKFYEKICDEMFLLDTVGPTTSKFQTLSWKHMGRPMWPLDSFEWNADVKHNNKK